MLTARVIVMTLFIWSCSGIACAEEVDEQVVRTGSFSLQSSPVDILGEDGATSFARLVPATEAIEWEVVVPENYDPKNPPGLFVYISPGNSGRIPRGWARLTMSRNLIWIAANRSGNAIQVARRIGYAVLATGLLDERYELNKARIYLSGFSGGARVSGLVASSYPGLFKGAVYMGGAEVWGEQPLPPNLAEMQNNRYVFMVGSEDGNRSTALSVQARYEDAGIEHTKIKMIRRVGHVLPEARHVLTALDFLDGEID